MHPHTRTAWRTFVWLFVAVAAMAAPAQASVPDRMKGPDGPKNRETMIRGMFTPGTPKPLQDHRLLTTFVDRLGTH